MSLFGLNTPNNNNIIEEETKKTNEDLLSNKSFEEDTIPDEEYNEMMSKREKLASYPNMDQKGPNINLKIYYKRYNSQKEKQYFFEKIKRKKKTELCKNYEFYHDCYYGEKCSFAHGIQELRDNILLPSYKTKMCKSFVENMTCNFGVRCSYKHQIK